MGKMRCKAALAFDDDVSLLFSHFFLASLYTSFLEFYEFGKYQASLIISLLHFSRDMTKLLRFIRRITRWRGRFSF